MPHLSKSRYRNFVKCPRLGYLSCFRERFEEYKRPSLADTIRIETGILVGEIARDYWPGGTLIQAGPEDLDRAKEETRRAIAAGADVLYEATFSTDDVLIRADILRRLEDGTWELVEVKSSSSIEDKKKLLVADVGVQLHVLQECGISVSRVVLMHLDREYVHPGGDTYDLQDLLVGDDLTEEAHRHIERDLAANLESFRGHLSLPDPPDVLVKNSCRAECEYAGEYCLPLAPPYRMTEMGHAWRLFDCFLAEGVDDLRDVGPERCPRALEELRRLSRAPLYLRMIQAVKEARLMVEEGLAGALDRIRHPIHFFDFEAWAPALPVFAGTHPYESIPFQWSDHCLTKDGDTNHAYYLADGPEDPRREVAQSLLRRLGAEGSVVVYHRKFEAGHFEKLAGLFPDLADELRSVVDRMVDLEPIVTDHVYHPDFHGSFSLKKVYPVLVSGPGYEELAIQEGEAAGLAFRELRLMSEGPEKAKLRSEMLAYCQMDTQAMVDLYGELKRLARSVD